MNIQQHGTEFNKQNIRYGKFRMWTIAYLLLRFSDYHSSKSHLLCMILCLFVLFAGEMIDKLTLLYNRTRQAVITRELVEIISGAAAIE